MAQRITLTLASELLEGVKAAKPKALSLASFCALLVEEGLSSGSTRPAENHHGASGCAQNGGGLP